MEMIKDMKQNHYLLVDAILIIINAGEGVDVDQLQYKLLNCGIMVQMPLLESTLEYLHKEGIIRNQPNKAGIN